MSPKIFLHRQLPDLRMQLVLYPVVLSGIADIRPKYCVSLGGQFLFPALDLIGMHVTLLG